MKNKQTANPDDCHGLTRMYVILGRFEIIRSFWETTWFRLTLLVAGGLFLSTPRVFLEYLPNGLS